MRRIPGPYSATLAVAVAVSLLLSACGSPERSAAAVCKVWDTQGLALHEKFEHADSGANSAGGVGLIGALIAIFGAPNDLATLMQQMADVAPSNVEPDFKALASAFKKLSDSESKALTDPLGALGSNLVESFAISGSYNRVNAFLGSHCGIPGR